jgi:hypothetical protein
MRYLAPCTVAVLLIATLGAFAYAQRLKREPLILDRVTLGIGGRPFTPNGDCINDFGQIRFRITHSDRANVEIVGPHGGLVATLARNRFLRRYRFFVFHWNGRKRGGGLAPTGRYKLRLVLLGDDRRLTTGGVLRLFRTRRIPHGCARGPGGIGPGAP